MPSAQLTNTNVTEPHIPTVDALAADLASEANAATIVTTVNFILVELRDNRQMIAVP